LDVDGGLSGDAPAIVGALLHIGDTVQKRYATRVRGLLKHSEPSVRAQAATCLGAIGGASLVIPLRALLTDPNASVCEAAKSAIAELMS
jgi:HEAT repeat protein